jgi:hypothetical protein
MSGGLLFDSQCTGPDLERVLAGKREITLGLPGPSS